MAGELSTAAGKAQPAVQPAAWPPALMPPLELRKLIGTVTPHEFRLSAQESFRLMREHGGLKPGDRVLDVGCGCGRVAVPLSGFLTTGSYDGFDIIPELIQWAKDWITPLYQNFRFRQVEVFNDFYRPDAGGEASQFRFPYESASFDFTVLNSVFTHLQPADAARYMSEIGRTLKPGGTAFMTFFVLNEESDRLRSGAGSTFKFPHLRAGGLRIESDAVPSGAVAYPEETIHDMLRASGLVIDRPILFGYWCGRNTQATFQDVVVARKAPWSLRASVLRGVGLVAAGALGAARALRSQVAETLRRGPRPGRDTATPGASPAASVAVAGPIALEEVATPETFDEHGYLTSNPDVRAAVAAGVYPTGADHFRHSGHKEGRKQRLHRPGFLAARSRKHERIRPLLRSDLKCVETAELYDFLSAELRAVANIPHTGVLSGHGYDPGTRELIERHAGGLLLDCGAGQRDWYYDNVVNFEIAPYDSTDVLGVGEELPFRDQSFDAVISSAVLEHVKDPFRCAREIVRVLKPGGELLCAVPFLQPYHGYPHHYYNMTHQGLRNLFEPSLVVDGIEVIESVLPVWALTWFLESWAAGLAGKTKSDFLETKVKDLLVPPRSLLGAPFVTELSREKNFELAAAFVLRAHKPGR